MPVLGVGRRRRVRSNEDRALPAVRARRGCLLVLVVTTVALAGGWPSMLPVGLVGVVERPMPFFGLSLVRRSLGSIRRSCALRRRRARLHVPRTTIGSSEPDPACSSAAHVRGGCSPHRHFRKHPPARGGRRRQQRHTRCGRNSCRCPHGGRGRPSRATRHARRINCPDVTGEVTTLEDGTD